MHADLFEAVDVGIDEFCSLHGFPASSPRLVNGLFCGQGVSEITYIHVHECNYFSVSLLINLSFTKSMRI